MMKNKKVLITGGANGIGLAITKAFVKQEAVVFVVDKDMVKGKELESLFPAVKFFCVDIVNEKAILAVFEELRSMGISLDVLVNNAGLSHFMALEACETSMWDEVINVNLRAPFIFSREFVRMHRGTVMAASLILHLHAMFCRSQVARLMAPVKAVLCRLPMHWQIRYPIQELP
jgi:NAD(P)-dependent dehydrogenase (short-subunit alcohol dehydrogenase family)